MSVVPASQLSLMRKRKQFEELLQQKKWQDVAALEAEFYQGIRTAVNDKERSAKELLTELNHIIRVYKELALLCQHHSKNLA